MKTDYSITSLLKELNRLFGWEISYVTFWTWNKKNYIGPSSRIPDGKRTLPVYYESDLKHIVAILRLLHESGKIRIKGYDNKAPKDK
jgi:hypothetical protein